MDEKKVSDPVDISGQQTDKTNAGTTGNGQKADTYNKRVRKFILGYFVDFLKDKFDLSKDRATQEEVVDNISHSVEFKGTNLWILIFATFIASLGLNVNSAAVIIGAMLISPLMGPIMGIGLSVGINNFDLMKRSLRNFGLMVAIAIITSTLYFYFSPINTAQSELLARTSPTIYDVMIAFFGGLAGIVAQSGKDRTSPVIPGVAIATALMPPLCTAGYGLATGQFKDIFLGAFYLFFINTIFIATATYVIVRFLNYKKKEFLDKKRETMVKRYMFLIVLLTLVPSVILSYNIVQKSVFDSNADKYVASVFKFDKTQVIDYKKTFKMRNQTSRIEIILIGEPVSQDMIDIAKAQMQNFNLNNVELIVEQSGNLGKMDANTLQLSYTQLLDEKTRQIDKLSKELSLFTVDTLALSDISREAGTVFDNIKNISLSKQEEYDTQGNPLDKTLVCVLQLTDPTKGIERDKLSRWLMVRTKSEKVRIFTD